MSALILGCALVFSGYLAFSPRLARSASWSATITPLASIMGSGLLVSAALFSAARSLLANLGAS